VASKANITLKLVTGRWRCNNILFPENCIPCTFNYV